MCVWCGSLYLHMDIFRYSPLITCIECVFYLALNHGPMICIHDAGMWPRNIYPNSYITYLVVLTAILDWDSVMFIECSLSGMRKFVHKYGISNKCSLHCGCIRMVYFCVWLGEIGVWDAIEIKFIFIYNLKLYCITRPRFTSKKKKLE